MYHKFNESKSHNRSLRTDIDNLRRERLVFDDIHRKLAKSLLVKRKEMAAVIAHTNHILESRDKVGGLESNHYHHVTAQCSHNPHPGGQRQGGGSGTTALVSCECTPTKKGSCAERVEHAVLSMLCPAHLLTYQCYSSAGVSMGCDDCPMLSLM